MAIVKACGASGCNVLTMGRYCIDHERTLDGELLERLAQTSEPTAASSVTSDAEATPVLS